MSKYDFKIDLSKNSSTGIILSKIPKGSVVLEFGCATGRMTHYMKEVLECQVYIVEYEEAAYEKARQYAQDGLCDDIMNFQWVEKFRDIQFDVILFVDVLEHLTAPDKALASAAGLLKDTGSLYISIPNVTHNDIVLKACEEHFDYTQTGLLDDTHVHFWGLKNIAALSRACGLHIREIEGTFCATGDTEQYAEGDRHKNILLENLLRQRQCGEVYQFVVSFDKSSGLDTVCTFRKPSIQSHIYLDTGADFNPDEKIDLESPYSGEGSYTAHYVIEDPGRIQRVRLDPVELQECILRRVSIRQDGKALPLTCPHAVEWEKGMFLPGNDPMVYAEVLAGGGPIEIEAEIVIPGEQYMVSMEDLCLWQQTENQIIRSDLEIKRKQIDSLLGQQKELEKQVDSLLHQQIELQRKNEQLTDQRKKLQEATNAMSQENKKLHTDLGAYMILANNKDKYILQLEQSLKELEQRLDQGLRQKIRRYLIRIYRGVKRRIKRLYR